MSRPKVLARGLVRIVLAEGDPVIREGLRRSLSSETDFKVVADAGDGRDVLSLIRETDADVLLMSLHAPNLDGLSTLERLDQANHRTRVILVADTLDDSDLAQAMMLGCSGVIRKDAAAADFAKSIRRVQEGGTWLDPNIMTAGLRQSLIDTGSVPSPERALVALTFLSSREREIVALVAQGCSNQEIAEEMFLSEETIKKYLRAIYRKLNVSDRLELTLQMIHLGGLAQMDLPSAS